MIRLLVLSGILLIASPMFAATYSPRVGEAHPDFILPRIDNAEPIRLSHLRGRRVLLVHFASW